MRRAAQITLTGFVFLLLATPTQADFITPGLNDNFSLDDLVTISGGAVTGSYPQYQINDSVVITQGDSLSIWPGITVTFAGAGGAYRLEINGTFLAHGAEADSIRFTSLNMSYGDYAGIDFRDTGPGSVFEMRYCSVEYAEDAIDVVYDDALVEHCTIRHSGGIAIDLTGSDSTIRHCDIRDNYKRTISINLGSAPLIEHCWIENNNLENVHAFPFINIGVQSVNSPVIRYNTIIGGSHMSGGIGVWLECDGLILENEIRGCGYGILCLDPGANPRIEGNHIIDNNIHPDTLNWGFGIACNGVNAPVITGNTIHGHWYGVALINGAQPNLGDLDNADPTDDGDNYFVGNGLDGNIYELYNNTVNDIKAENNYWNTNDPLEIADSIVDSEDDPSLGTVDWMPFLTIIGVEDYGDRPAAHLLDVQPAYPNPFNPRVTLFFELGRPARVQARIYDATGRLVRILHDAVLPAGGHELTWHGTDARGTAVPSGVYFYRINTEKESEAGKLVLIR